MTRILICLVLFCPLAAAAQPASMSQCEGIKNDLAYNQCLASFGPKRGERPAHETADDDDDGPAARAPGRRQPAVRRNGRQSAAFDVMTGRGSRRTR